jgi:hypothetical protein
LLKQTAYRVGPWESCDGAVPLVVRPELLDVEAVLIDDAAIVLGQSNHLGAGPVDELGRVPSHVSKPLDDYGLVLHPWAKAQLVGQILQQKERTSLSGSRTGVS